MKIHAQARRYRGNESPWSGHLIDADLNDDQPELSIEASQAARAKLNIETWRAYLPQQCIDTMISLGWDRST